MAVVAPIKAGKSTIINAIVGQPLLPARNTAMTAIATEIILDINIHLEDGVPWNRYEFPNLTIIEIRPQALLNTSNTLLFGSLESLLDFRGDRIAALQA
ncbi:dynamin family protein [Thermosynechococcus sp. HN-54]|uniref:dynamin family protein n=1 Tax=Thermosynechococcus sp. HN-54 TaxID=2933959 RepID=UPI00202CD307|nr:dynamin family protein [Thermosynechococcus sp. HN-54]